MSANRMHYRNKVHLITNRTEHEMFLLQPTPEITELIQGWFARALCEYGEGLEIYAFIFLGNHFHILLKDTQGTIAAFLWYFQANLARAVNRKLDRKGRFWSREYDDVIVEDDKDFWDVYAYTVSNAVKSGLVETSSEWPGWSSLDGALGDGKYNFKLFNRTRYHNATRRGQRRDKSEFMEEWQFKLAVPPSLGNKSIEHQKQFMEETLKTAEEKYRSARSNKPPLGIKNILRQHPLERPLNSSFTPRRKFHCSDEEKTTELIKGYRTFVGRYKEVYEVYLTQSLTTKSPALEWPEASFPPSCLHPVFRKAG